MLASDSVGGTGKLRRRKSRKVGNYLEAEVVISSYNVSKALRNE